MHGELAGGVVIAFVLCVGETAAALLCVVFVAATVLAVVALVAVMLLILGDLFGLTACVAGVGGVVVRAGCRGDAAAGGGEVGGGGRGRG